MQLSLQPEQRYVSGVGLCDSGSSPHSAGRSPSLAEAWAVAVTCGEEPFCGRAVLGQGTWPLSHRRCWGSHGCGLEPAGHTRPPVPASDPRGAVFHRPLAETRVVFSVNRFHKQNNFSYKNAYFLSVKNLSQIPFFAIFCLLIHIYS